MVVAARSPASTSKGTASREMVERPLRSPLAAVKSIRTLLLMKKGPTLGGRFAHSWEKSPAPGRKQRRAGRALIVMSELEKNCLAAGCDLGDGSCLRYRWEGCPMVGRVSGLSVSLGGRMVGSLGVLFVRILVQRVYGGSSAWVGVHSGLKLWRPFACQAVSLSGDAYNTVQISQPK